jgi:hypothetical protein
MPKEKEKEIRDRISDVDFSKVICPITFIGDKITNSNSVNSLYIQPYISHKAMKYVSEKSIEKFGTEDAEWEYNNAQEDSLRIAIISYIRMNLYTLTYDTMLKFIQEAFAFEIDNKLLPDGVNKPASIYIIEKYINLINMDIQQVINDCISARFYFTRRIMSRENITMREMHEIVASYMSTVFSQIVDRVFNNAINRIIDNSLKDGSFETIFDIVYYSCYNESPSAEYKTNVQIMVQFVSGYLRQVMEGHLEMYRNGLDLMTMTITGMIFGKETA